MAASDALFTVALVLDGLTNGTAMDLADVVEPSRHVWFLERLTRAAYEGLQPA